MTAMPLPRLSRSRAAHHPALMATVIVAVVLCRAEQISAGQRAPAGGAGTRIASVRVGFDGRYKTGYWAPVQVELQEATPGQQVAVRLVVPDGDGVPTAVTQAVPPRVKTRPGRTRSVALTAKLGRAEGGLTAQLLVDGRIRAQRRFAAGLQQDDRHIRLGLDTLDRLLVTLERAGRLAEAIRIAVGDRWFDVHVVDVPGANELPIRWVGYDAVDTLVLSTGNPDALRGLAEDPARRNALIRWVERGGRLVLFLGQDAAELWQESSVLAALAPGRFDKLVSLSQAPALENYSQSEHPIAANDPQTRLHVVRITDVEGTIEAHEGTRPADLPLVVRTPFGFGQVTLVTVDPDQPPLRNWKGISSFLRKVLPQAAAGDGGEAVADVSPYFSLGFVDLTGQLRSAMDHFDDVQTVPFALVAALVMVYILAIGPLDYWIVKKFLGRMELTWVTFPCWVILFSAGACLLAYWFKGHQLRVNQAEIVDVDIQRRLVRGKVFTHLFSPRPATYDVAMSPALADGVEHQSEDRLVSWMGLPGASLGSMGGTARAASYFTRPYDFAPDLDALYRVPVQVWSTKSFSTRWSARITTPLIADLHEEQDGMLSGTVRNPWPFDLPPSHLLYGRWVYTLPPVKAGRVQNVNETLHPRFAKSWLRDRRSSRAFQLPGADQVPEILSMMMFYELAGGRQYTGLANRYYSECDLSDHLNNGRAVLVVRMPKQHSRLHLNGQPVDETVARYWSVYRFIFPVHHNSRET